MTTIKAQTEETPRLRLRRLGIDTYREFVVFMNRDCAVCRSEGFQVRSRVRVGVGDRSLTATLNVVGDDILGMDEASLSEAAWTELGANPGTYATISHPDPVASDSFLRKKIYGGRLSGPELSAIVADIVGRAYDDIRLAAFVTACAGDRLNLDETIELTRAMVAAGERLTWPGAIVADKHCVGGLPGNRTTMIVVPIIAAAGLLIPKTSSRAITSPAGTADAMEALATVDLSIDRMRAIVEKEGGCIAWGGAAQLSPADDVLIGVERPLDLDSEGQLVASVLSKKIAAGATHVVLDVPVGPTAKIRDQAAAIRLSARLRHVAEHFGLVVDLVLTDGSQPVGRGIGPSLEARDVLAVLGGDAGGPDDLRDRALTLAGRLIDLARPTSDGAGRRLAGELLASGAALRKFEAICEAQGGMKRLATAAQRRDVTAERDGIVTAIDNRKLAKAAKLAGAPSALVAGVDFHAPLGRHVARGETLFTLHAATRSELDYAMAYVAANADIVALSDDRTGVRSRKTKSANHRLVLPLPGNERFARRLAAHGGWPVADTETRRFPDGETYFRVLSDVRGRPVDLVCTLAGPDEIVLRLLFAADAVRSLGASQVTLVAPYLAYMRQDKAFHPGEAITSKTFATLLAASFDRIVTVDPHLHRYPKLDALYDIPADTLHAAPVLADWIAANVPNPLLIGPDEESAQWVADIGARIGAPWTVLRKIRRGDRDVEIAVPDLAAFGGRQPVLVDDIASSGRTLIAAARQFQAQGLPRPVCAVVHALFSEGAFRLLSATAAKIVSTDTVPHESNAMSVIPIMAACLRGLPPPAATNPMKP